MKSLEKKVPKNKGREFALTFSVLFAIIFLYGFYSSQTANYVIALIALAFLIFGLLTPQIFIFPARIWLKFGLILGKIINPIVLGVLFFVILTPYAFFLRIFGKKFLQTKADNIAKSYWIKSAEIKVDKEFYKNQY